MINEIFGEHYTGEETILFSPNEHFLDQQNDANQERITDTNFTIWGREKKKYHLDAESIAKKVKKAYGSKQYR